MAESTNQEQRPPGRSGDAGNPVDREKIRPGTGVPLEEGNDGAIEAPDGPLNTDAGTLAANPPPPGDPGREGTGGQSQNR